MNKSAGLFDNESGMNSDLDAFSREELAAMNHVLAAIFHSRNFDTLTQGLFGATRVLGVTLCGIYRLSDNKLGLALLSASEDCTGLPDLIPQSSDMFQILSACGSVRPLADSEVQLSLFQSAPVLHLESVTCENAVVGAVAAIHTNDHPEAVAAILVQTAAALGLLSSVKGNANNLSLTTTVEILSDSAAKPAASEHGFGPDVLTAREKEIMILLSQGLSTRQISERLYISPATCKNHIQNIFEKLDIHSRTAAVAYSLSRYGLARS